MVVGKGGDTFRVDIGSADNASLSFMAFEGATKKNKPNINVGDVVYAKLLVASRDMEPELVCVDSYGKKGRDSFKSPPFTFSIKCQCDAGTICFMYSLSQLVVSVHFYDYEESDQDTSCGNSAKERNQMHSALLFWKIRRVATGQILSYKCKCLPPKFSEMFINITRWRHLAVIISS